MAAKRLRHKIPVSLRHYWKLIVGSIALVMAVAVLIGSVRVSALVYSDATEGFQVNWDIQGTVDLFDTSVAHDISIDYDDNDYESMIETFEDSGDKEWIKATVTIDSTTINDVGIRLKGNSTLEGLGGGETMGPPGGGEPPPGGGGPPSGDLSLDEPESLPWLVDFSKYVDGQVYQGRQQIALRVDTGMGASTLAEPVAAEMIAAGGQPSYDWNYSTVSVNGSDAAPRRIVGVMDVPWSQQQYGEGAGVLYKSRAGSQFSYQGDDPGEYDDDFKQVNMEGSADVQPVIKFLRWLDSADDDVFDSELDEWVDVESFARYVALQNLIANGDDMAGPGSNYYLWYDYETGLISVITWDLDLSLMSADLAPDETNSFREMMESQGDAAGELGPGPGDMPEGGAEPEGNGPGGELEGNELKERFLDSTAFDDVYTAAYHELYEAVYASGAASEAIDRAAVAADLNGEEVTADAETLQVFVRERVDFLESELDT